MTQTGPSESVRIRCLRWTPYRVPFVHPMSTTHGVLSHREGLIVRLEGDDGSIGTGEAAPLPEFAVDGGTVDTCVRLLRAAGMVLAGSPIDRAATTVSRIVAAKPGGMAVLAAIDGAALDAHARRTGRRMADLLGGTDLDRITVNATIGATSLDQTVAAAQVAVGRGFRTLKLKAGIGAPEDEVERVQAVRAAVGPDVRLRLDANGGWSVEQAAAILPGLERFGIELIEQPVAADDIAGMAELRRLISIPIAADEALTGVETLQAIIERQAADTIIIKPSLRGGPTASLELARLAGEAGMSVIVTSAFETGVGLATALQVAAAISSSESPSTAHGLATAHLLESSLVKQLPAVVGGSMVLPDGPGNGVEVDEAALAHYATGPEVRA